MTTHVKADAQLSIRRSLEWLSDVTSVRCAWHGSIADSTWVRFDGISPRWVFGGGYVTYIRIRNQNVSCTGIDYRGIVIWKAWNLIILAILGHVDFRGEYLRFRSWNVICSPQKREKVSFLDVSPKEPIVSFQKLRGEKVTKYGVTKIRVKFQGISKIRSLMTQLFVYYSILIHCNRARKNHSLSTCRRI